MRPSDNSDSEPRRFQYTPLGRRSISSSRKSIKVKGSYEPLNRLLSLDEKVAELKALANGLDRAHLSDKTAEIKGPNLVASIDAIDSAEKTSEWLQKSEFCIPTESSSSPRTNNTANRSPALSQIADDEPAADAQSVKTIADDITLTELLEQVAELDQIYSGYQLKRDSKLDYPKMSSFNDASVDFDDTATYTSLQIAFKNPISISEPEPRSYDVVCDALQLIKSSTPVIDITPMDSPVKSNGSAIVEEEKLPPLPPKRIRKITAENTEYNANLLATPTHSESNASSSNDDTAPKIIIKRTPENRSPASSANSSLQSSPQKKQGFFSRIFRRKSKHDIAQSATEPKNSPNISRESSFNTFDGFDRNHLSTRSFRTPQSPSKKCKPVGRSVSSVSGKRPHLTADIVHIPLKGFGSDSLPQRSGSGNLLPEHYSSNVTLSNNLDRKTVSALQLADIPLQEGNMELIAIADAQSLKNLCEGQYGVQLDADVDLSEAEHFAVYTTSAAAHTNGNGFDDAAFFAPVEAAEVVPNSEIAKRLAMGNQPH